MLENTATYQEIASQPQAWAQASEQVIAQTDALLDLWKTGEFTNVIFTGCGSTYYLSMAAASLFQQLVGCPARAVPAGELLLYPDSAYPRSSRTLLVAISRSGRTTETLLAVKQFQKYKRGEVLTITNYGDQPLAAMGNLSIVIPAGQEESIAQTRSFASMYVAATALAAALAGDAALLNAFGKLPSVGDKLIERYAETARIMGTNLMLDRFYFLGSGPRYGLACEANLKMKEMSLTHSEAFPFLEFRHGPMSMINENSALIALVSESNRDHEQAVVDQMEALGALVLSLGEADADVSFHSSLPEEIRNVLYLPVLQLIALQRAVAKGLDPDHPNNLTAVVELTTLMTV